MALAAVLVLGLFRYDQFSHSGPLHVQAKEEVELFKLTPAFAAKNDLPVLKAALSHLCSRKSRFTVLSDKAIDRLDDRSHTKMAEIPLGLECAGIKIVDQRTIDEAFEREVPPPHDPLKLGWEGFYDRFPGASGLGSISMPVYTQGGTYASVFLDSACGGLCGAGFEFVLRKERGVWIVKERIPRWIS